MTARLDLTVTFGEVVILFFFNGATTLCGLWPPPGVGEGNFWRFRQQYYFSGMVSLAPRPTRNLENQGLHFVWTIIFDLSGICEITTSLRSSQHSSPGHWEAQTSSPTRRCSPRGGDGCPLFRKSEYLCFI
jgi:hypothetical protein